MSTSHANLVECRIPTYLKVHFKTYVCIGVNTQVTREKAKVRFKGLCFLIDVGTHRIMVARPNDRNEASSDTILKYKLSIILPEKVNNDAK